MTSISDININNYAYLLPDDKIAKYPLEQRDESKLLVYKNQTMGESKFKNLPEFLLPNALLVFNNTKVIHARLLFRKETGATIEIFCLEPHNPADYYQIFETSEQCTWICLVGNKRKWKSSTISSELTVKNQTITLTAKIKGVVNESFIVEFNWNGQVSFGEILESMGNIPIPPYLNRQTEQIDYTRYQTIYSQVKGSVAAPTAGLHFTPELLEKLSNKPIHKTEITLHVGAGTFQPVKTERISEHHMHTEQFSVSIETLKALAKTSMTIAVGTTSLRTIESIYQIALKIILGNCSPKEKIHLTQWEAYEYERKYKPKDMIMRLVELMESEKMDRLHASTQIIIVPGYKFTLTDGLITNFHLPKSTLLLLIAALVGESWREIYTYALNHNFRFLSYGDSSLLIP